LWRTAARRPSSNTQRICEALPDESTTVWQWLSAWSLLRNYPDELLERILSLDHVSFVRGIPEEGVNDIALEPNARGEALTQIDLLMRDISSQVCSSEDFRKVVGWLSGRLPEEFRHVSRLLSGGRFEPTCDDIEPVEGRFRTCPGVSRSQLKSLRHSVRPDYPTLIDASETWDADRWIQWTVDEYTPYRDWQVHNRRFDAELEKTVVRFSDWYVESYLNIQGDMDLGLAHSLSFLATGEFSNGLSIVLIVDCLPVSCASLMDSALRDVGFRRHGLRCRYAALPTTTENNKQALVWGTPEVSQNTYESLLKERSARDWGGTQTHYVPSLKALSDLKLTSDPAVVVVNYVDGDDLMHADVEARNTTYEEELSRLYFHLAETVAEFCERWPGGREDISLHLVTDHGACRVLEEETRTFDSSLINKLFDDEKHRVAHIASDQAEKIPENLWNIGYRFEPPFASTEGIHFLPKGHNTVRKSRAKQGYKHGGVSPEEVIVPVGVYRMTAVSWKKPAIRFMNLDMVKTGDRARFYIQRIVTVEIEVQNPNSSSLRVIGLEVTGPGADIKSMKLPTVSPGSVEILRTELYFRKTALQAGSLDIKLAYEIGGEEFGLSTSLPTEFKSAMSGGELTEEGRSEIVNTVSRFLPQKADKNTILNRLMEQEEVRILDDFRVNVSLERNTHDLSIPLLDISNGMVQKDIVDDNPMLLKTGMWGLGTLRYVPPDGEEVKKGQIWMMDFKAFQSPGVDLEYFRESRKAFEIEEWIDLLVSSCQFNPDILRLSQKLLLLSRIIPLIEPRANLTELAPKGTGKSFVFDNISRYAAVIPGGKLSAPALFFNSNTKQIGLIPRYDVVVVDEIQKIQTDASGEAMAALKMYLESGRYRRATGDMGTSESGFVMLGNITLGLNRLPLYESDGIFKELPIALQESAFIDRIHGLIEGWFIPRVSRNTPSKSLGFKGDFFSEVLHELRVDLQYADYVSQNLYLPDCEDMRDNKAIARLAEGFLKLLFPDLKLTDEEFNTYCLNPAIRMRQQIRDELSKIDHEYRWVTIKSRVPDEFQLSHPTERPDPEQENAEIDPLDAGRSPEEKTVDIAEGQRGVSFEKLFLPYVKDAREIRICDPYIRLQYQLFNLMSFCEILEPQEGPIKVSLVTTSDSYHEDEILNNLTELKKGLSRDDIELDFSFDPNLHDRWIETDTGWRIILGRGLDIFQKPEDKFTLGFMDQTKRRCKATTVVYSRRE